MIDTTRIEPARRSSHFGPLLRVGRDFLLGLALFGLVYFATSKLDEPKAQHDMPLFSSSAHATPTYTITTGMRPAGEAARDHGAADNRKSTLILGLAFAAIVAFDLALLRHLRRVYASPR